MAAWCAIKPMGIIFDLKNKHMQHHIKVWELSLLYAWSILYKSPSIYNHSFHLSHMISKVRMWYLFLHCEVDKLCVVVIESDNIH